MRKIFLRLCMVGLCFAVIFGIWAGKTGAVTTGAWGLGFQEEGQPPTGSASAAVLRDYDAAYIGSGEEKVLYLTFDAGYENGYTGEILNVLKKHNVPAAFFLTGHYIESSADLVRRMVEEGHIVGNHTVHHPDMAQIATQEAFLKELTGLEERFREATGKEMPKFYRPPRGIYSKENLQMAKDLGYKTIFWSLAYADWDNNKQPSKEFAFQKLLPRTHNGAVILLHATSRTNAEILDELLTRWKNAGYTFESIDKLFD